MPRTLPNDLEAEMSLLGAMLISKEKSVDILTKAVAQDFYDPRHEIIFNAMEELNNNMTPIDITTLSSYLSDHGQLDKVGGVEYLLQLSDSVPTVGHSEYYLKILHNKSILRRIISETTNIAEQAYNDIDNIDAFIDETEKTILSITQDRAAGEFEDIRKVVGNITKKLSELLKNKGSISGVSSGFRDLDKITSGFQKGDLIILAARPAMGKTAFALNIAANAAEVSKDPDANNDPVAVFSLEMPAEQLVQRIICSKGSVEGSLIRTGEALKVASDNYYGGADKASRLNLYIDDTAGIKINEIVAKSRKLKQEHGLKLIVIDYLQLITTNAKNRENRQQEVSEISRQLKGLARELEVPVIALSQLSRSVEQRPNKRPMMSDLRESGSIEQDADIVSFIYREDYYADVEEQAKAETKTAEVIIAKHRNGATGEVELVFEKNYSRFSDLAKVGMDPQNGVKDLRN